jgi:hypothetical protein
MSKRLILALAVFVAACGAGESPQSEMEPEPEPQATPTQGREETQAIRRVEIPGHDSTAIANQVDATLNEADERKKRYEQEADGGAEAQPE